MTFGEKLKFLRNEKAISQDELSEKIGGNGRQISNYENNKMMPSADAIIRIADYFKVSADYLLFKDAVKRPLMLNKNILFDKLLEIENLEEADKNALLQIITSLTQKAAIKKLANS